MSIGVFFSYRDAVHVGGDRPVGVLMPRVNQPPDMDRSSIACALRPSDALRSIPIFELTFEAMVYDRGARLVGATR